MAWTRRTAGGLGSAIGIGTTTGSGWTLTQFRTGGLRNELPALAFDGVTTDVAWIRDGQVVESDSSGGPVHTFGPSTTRPAIARSGAVLHVGYTLDGPDGPTAGLAEHLAIGWTSVTLPGSVALDVYSYNGKARLLVHEELHDYSIIEQK